MNVEDLHKRVLDFFDPAGGTAADQVADSEDGRRTLLIALTTDDIEQNMRDLGNKNFISHDEDLSMYEYVKD